jgi:hypothetical protein
MKHTIANFKYDKQDGSPVTNRKLLVMSKPSDTWFGVEFEDEAEIKNVLAYMQEREMFDEYLKHKYNLTTANYKRFKEEKIKSLTEELITVI